MKKKNLFVVLLIVAMLIASMSSSVFACGGYYYQPKTAKYTVYYKEYGTNTQLAPSVTKCAVAGKKVTENAIYIDNYTVYGESIKSIRISVCKCNTIIFYYVKKEEPEQPQPRTCDVTVKKYGYELIDGKEVVTVDSLPGAKLQILDSKGNKVYPEGSAEYFVSEDKPSVIKLAPGEYKLVELEAPEGYERTDKEVGFTVAEPSVTGIDPSANYTGMQDSLRDGVYLVDNAAVYLNGKSIGVAMCVQPGPSLPRTSPGNSGYKYYSEAEFDGLTSLQKARIKKMIDMYLKQDAGAVAKLKSGGYGLNTAYIPSSLYRALSAATTAIISPSAVNLNSLPKNNSTGNVPAAAKYFVDEAKKINSESDLPKELQNKRLAFFVTNEYIQNLVLLQLFDGNCESTEVSMGNKAVEYVQTKVEKKWVNSKGEEITWPEGQTVTVNITYGEDSEELTLDADHPVVMTKKFKKVEGGKFTVGEVDIDGYSVTVTENDDGTFTLTNTEDVRLTDYVVKYLHEDGYSVYTDRIVRDVEVGAEITEVAKTIEGFIALSPTEKTLVMQESGNVFEFIYREDDPSMSTSQ